MEAIVSLFGSNSVAITFPLSSKPTLSDLKRHLLELYSIPIEEQRILSAGGEPLSTTGNDIDDDGILLFDEKDSESGQPIVRSFGLTMRLSGGKGGFGSMLRAQGGRMSSQKSTNTDACRDLSGRRIKTVNEAKRMAEYVRQEPERQQAKKETLKRKIEEKLELAERPTRKHRFEDSKFLDESEEQVEEVKSAVAAAIKESMKKSLGSGSGSGSSSVTAVDIKGKGKAKALEQEIKKPVKKSLGMWDDMSDYESSEGDGEDEDEDEDEDEEEEEEEDEQDEKEDEAKVPSIESSSSASSSTLSAPESSALASNRATKGRGKGRAK